VPKILLVAGARPNFMKIAPVLRALEKVSQLEGHVVHTGQHYDQNMSENFFKGLGIKRPKYNLEVGSGSHAVQTANIMIKFEQVCMKEEPDLVLVVGDVNSTIATGLVAKKLHIDLAHVEAGLRSRDRDMPEEINRMATDAITDMFFTTEKEGTANLLAEGHDKIASICDTIRADPKRYESYKIFPCMPYAHKYANAVTELGIVGMLKEYIPGNIFSTVAKGGLAFARKDFAAMMELLVDAEMKMFKGIQTPVIFLQNVVTDLLLGLGMNEFFVDFNEYVRKKYNAEAGFITMNLPKLLDVLEKKGITNPIICASINKTVFRMSGGKEVYEKVIAEQKCRCIAMQVLAAGAIRPAEAFEYVCGLKGVSSILFGASTKAHITESKKAIEEFSKS
jgi:hypothetical protein